MLGGLYGDLPPPSSASSTSTDDDSHSTKAPNNVWSSSVKMAPPTLRKPPSLSKPTLIKPPKSKTPIPPLPDPNPNPNPNPIQSSSFQPALVAVTSSVIEEYDPARPNDYEEYVKERKRKAAEAEIKKEIDRRRQQEEERERKDKRDRESKETNINLNVNISGEEAWKRRAAMSANVVPRRSASPGEQDGDGDGDGFSIEKSEKKVRGVSINGQPTRVVLLRNMVGPGEVDDDLEGEVAEECSKYGTVTRVLIFEITEPGFPVDEAVRIFVQFERSEQATKALVDLEGRFFGGRVVRATFYDEERFNTNQLAPVPGEIPGFI